MKIVIKKTDGIDIMTVIGNSDTSEELRKWKDFNVGKYVSHKEMPDNSIPEDRTFRDAWDDTTPELTIDIDMGKAREIHLNRIRIKRNAKLSQLDIEAMKAQDIGDAEALEQIRAQKQELRDLPVTLALTLGAANSVDALKAIQPLG